SVVVVVGHQRELVSEAVDRLAPELGVPVSTAVQEEQNGTGDAVAAGMAGLPADFRGTVLVTTSDVPLLDAATLDEVVARHEMSPRAAVTVLTSTASDPAGYGRAVRTDDGEGLRIGAHSDASQRELSLTDVIQLARQADGLVRGHRIDDADRVAGVNDRVQLAALAGKMNRRLCEAAMRGGATIIDPGTTWLDVGARLGRDVTILPGTHLRGDTVVGGNATVGPDSTLQDTTVGEGATVVRTHSVGATVGAGAEVGPFAYLRPAAELGESTKIG